MKKRPPDATHIKKQVMWLGGAFENQTADLFGIHFNLALWHLVFRSPLYNKNEFSTFFFCNYTKTKSFKKFSDFLWKDQRVNFFKCVCLNNQKNNSIKIQYIKEQNIQPWWISSLGRQLSFSRSWRHKQANGGSNPIEVWCINRSGGETPCCNSHCRTPGSVKSCL